MAGASSGLINANDIKLEPMEIYFGERNSDCITALPESSLTGGEYFDFEVTDFDGNLTLYRAWYDIDNGSVAPAAGGRTLVEIDIATGDTASQVASKSATDLATGVASGMSFKSVTDQFILTQHAMGSVVAAVDGADPTGFTFDNVAVGSKAFLGGTNGAIEVSFDQTFVDITADQTGATLLGQLVSSVSANFSASFLEMTQERWAQLVGTVMGSQYTPAGGTELVGVGASSIGKNLLTLGKELLLKPVNSAADNSRNLTLFKTAPLPESINFSGTELSAMSVTFQAYLDSTKNAGINLFAFGDSFQNVEA